MFAKFHLSQFGVSTNDNSARYYSSTKAVTAYNLRHFSQICNPKYSDRFQLIFIKRDRFAIANLTAA